MDLPVVAVLPEVTEFLVTSRAAVLSAPPGSGKTTLVPIHLLSVFERIVMLEPRKVATRAAARRMAFLLGEQVGETVGYVTRDDRRVGSRTRIEVVTEGVLTRRLQHNPTLAGVDLVIFDEFHERNLQSDLGLALLLDARTALRPDLAILVMSATLDSGRVAGHLGGAPVIEAAGITHPVELRWTPPPRQGRAEDHVAAIVRRSLQVDSGDILVFLPGIGEINRVRERLTGAEAEIHRLHGALPADEQDAALQPTGRRKVILSTDIAESSLTVEGVSVVVDDGRARIPRHDPRTGMTRLVVTPISRASADQRSGRAGRMGPGVAYRMWSKIEHGTRNPHRRPEISTVDLSRMMLELLRWGVTDPAQLPFLDPPPPGSVEEAFALLRALGAVDGEHRLTALGERMIDLPVHPRLAAMIARSQDRRSLACLVAALIDDRDILRGDDNPIDLALRVSLVAGIGSHPDADRSGVERVRRSWADLRARTGTGSGPVDPGETGRVAALGFPDRLAIRRGSPGRFQLRTSTTAWCHNQDHLAGEPFLVAVDLDGKRKDARIRLAAAIDPDTLVDIFGSEVETRRTLEWSDDRLVDRIEEGLGGIVLRSVTERAAPRPETVEMLKRRLLREGIQRLAWTAEALTLRARIEFLRGRFGEPWPDVSWEALTTTVDEWLTPRLGSLTSMEEVARIDLAGVMRERLGRLVGELDRLAPTHVELVSGRRIGVRYVEEGPLLSARVQEFFGTGTTPLIGGVPALVELLSPAGRPVQITSDLTGFWAGSWQQVRKEMKGRYPKHSWPEDPTKS